MKTKKHFAFDTETKQGRAFLLAGSGDFGSFCREIKNESDVLRFFKECTEYKYGNTGWGYNLDYDVLALFKYFKTDFLQELYLKKELTYKKFDFQYIPKKFLGVTYKGNRIFFYELMQYYNMSLDNASEKFLGENKIDIGGKKVLKDMYKYYLQNKKQIANYCIRDAELTYELARKLDEMILDCGLNVYKFYSCGYLAKQYLKKQGVNYDSLSDSKAQEFVGKSYFGGRIEFVQKGYFKNSYQYDICSAYPYACMDLENIVHTIFLKNIDSGAKYFFVDAELNIPDLHLSPATYREKMLVVYPTGKIRGVFDNYTWQNVKQYCTKIHSVLNCFTDGEKPFFDIVNLLYQKRLGGNESEKYILKIILNSIYGKFAQKNTDYKQVEDLKGLLYVDNNFLKSNRGVLSTKFGMFKKIENYAKESNIVYASLITAKIRNLIFEVANQLGESYIGCMTDSVFCTKPIPNKYVTTKKQLGKFEQKQTGFLYVIGSGVYQTPEGTKFRGYKTDKNLVQLAMLNSEKKNINIPSTEKKGLGKLVVQGIAFTEVNNIYENVKSLKLNFDRKRIWEKDFLTFGDSLKKCITSKPLNYVFE